jgi:hypothetical protein
MAHVFRQRGWLSAIVERVQFARARFGIYDTIDFLVVLLGYAVSGEPTLEAFYERLQPLGLAFMGLFERADLPSRSALSQYLKALDQGAVEALRTLFQEDLGASHSLGLGGLYDREGRQWVVIDVDATREAARQRALPHGPDLPPAHRRMDAVCAPGYTGRKRGEVVRSRTTVLQAHMQSWLGTFGGAGNGDYRGELLRAIEAIRSAARAWSIPLSRILIRLDGLYGNASPLIAILTAGLGVVVRGKEYALLDLPAVQARLALPPDAWTTHPESGVQRALFDCPGIALTPTGITVRMIVAVHPACATPAPIGITKNGLVSEIFFTSAGKEAFTASDVLHVYLHRGSFETVLAHEDQEQDPDRWVSHAHWGQECWQILSQWIWNLRLELGQHLEPVHLRLTQLIPEGAATVSDQATLIALMGTSELTARKVTPPVGYGPPTFSTNAAHAGFPGTDFALQSDGTLRCPADKPLYPQAPTQMTNGSLRITYVARIAHCRSCSLRCPCQGSDKPRTSARRVSAISEPQASDAPASDLSSLVETNASSVSVEAENAPVEADELASTPLASLGSDEAHEHPLMIAPRGIIPVGYGPPTFSAHSAHGGFPGTAFSFQPDGTVLCPAQHALSLYEHRPLANGSIRLVYAARLGDCRDCSLRSACQGPGKSPRRGRRVHAVCQPLPATEDTTTVATEPSPLQNDQSVPPVLEPAPCPISPASLQTEPASSVPTLLQSPSAPAQVVLVEMQPSPPAGVNVATGLQSPSAPLQAASLANEPLPPPTASGPPRVSPRSSPTLWQDWPASRIRLQWQKRLRTQTVHLTIGPPKEPPPVPSPLVLTRAQRAHWRLSWRERFARNARREEAPPLEITLHGLPASFAKTLALDIAA